MLKDPFLRPGLFIFLLAIFPNIFSQNFNEQTDITLTGVYKSSVAWGDYDNDGYLDILLTGTNNSGENTTKIYHNNGNNTFTEMTGIVLTQVGQSSAEWGDYDNDGDLDILLTGISDLGYTSKIYRNDGSNTFTDTGINLTGVFGWSGSSSWSDYDNDGDLDVMIAGGADGGLAYVALIYRNDGNDIFIKQTNIVLQGYAVGTSDWGDYDNDGDLDILVTGFVYKSIYLATIYKNNGDNSFSEQTGIELPEVQSGAGVFGDYDNDGDLDIFITGLDVLGKTIIKIFRNDGAGTFIEQTGMNLIGAGDSQLDLGDYDNDGNIDFLLTGHNNTGQIISKIYRNNGEGSFSEQPDINLTGVYWGSSAWGDYDNDGDLDILISGGSNSGYITKIYTNELNITNLKPSAPGNLRAETENGLLTFKWEKSIDNETHQDGLNYNMYIYENEQDIYECPPHAFKQPNPNNGKRLIAKSGSIQWNSSGYKINGLAPGKTYKWSVQAVDNGLKGGEFSSEQSFTVPLYRPDKQAEFITFSNIILPNITVNWAKGNGSMRAVFIKEEASGTADPVDGSTYNVNDLTPDGWKCIYNGAGNSVEVNSLIAGTHYLIHVCEYNGQPGNELYLKSGSDDNPAAPNTLLLELSQVLDGIQYANIQWIDYDNDGYLDISLAGRYGIRIYHNNKDDSFTDLGDPIVPYLNECSVAWGDYDNDNDLDILLTGESSGNLFSTIFRNDGDGTFTEQSGIIQDGVTSGSAAWGDYDNDGDLDILLSGLVISTSISKIFRNNGPGSFTEQASINVIGVRAGSACWGDYNKDSYPDILITGISDSGPVSRIYRNNSGTGFTELSSSLLSGVRLNSSAWGDYDNDGDLDILLSGSDIKDMHISKVYRNEGEDIFKEQPEIDLTGVNKGSVEWIDFDSDGDLDISIAGYTGTDVISSIYINNGDNNFSDKLNLEGLYYVSDSWGDFDNDGDPDFLVTGRTIGGWENSKIYKNEIPVINTPPSYPDDLQASWENDNLVFKWQKASDNSTPGLAINYNIRIGTVTGGNNVRSGQALPDGKLLMPGINMITDTVIRLKLPVNKYYWSVQSIDKSGLTSSFAPEHTIPADTIQATNLQAFIKTNSSLLIRWKNGNGSGRAVFCRVSSPEESAKPANGMIFHAEPFFGQGDKIESTSWYCIFSGKADSAVIYGLSEKYSYDIQVVDYIDGENGPLYFDEEGNGNPGIFSTSLFSEQTGIQLTGLRYSSSNWADYDNDGDLDILLTGSTNGDYTGVTTIIYGNNGNNTFTEQTEIELAGTYSGKAAWGDFNNDDKLDLIITGTDNSNQKISKVYLNNGDNTFTEQISLVLPGISNGSVLWGDYNNDNNLDLLMTGSLSSGEPTTSVFRNEGVNGFTEQTDFNLTGLTFSSSALGDYDNDGDLDILLAGTTNYIYTGAKTTIYNNRGNNTFTEDAGNNLTGLFNSSVAWGDYDNDNDLDILMFGNTNQAQHSSIIYQNNEKNKLYQLSNAGLINSSRGSAEWADYDNDGNLDILLAGFFSRIYNNKNSIFSEYTGTFLPPVSSGSASWGDYDNDSDIDILITGGGLSRIYRNNTFMKAGDYSSNHKPIAPSGMSAMSKPDGTYLSWSHVRTDETPFRAMTYNLKIGTSSGGSNIVIPHSNTVSGYRKIVAMGNAQSDTTFLIKNIPSGTYFWSVQAVDQGYKGGNWSAEGSFEVKNVQPFFSSEEVCQGLPTQFTDQSVAADGIASWSWDFGDGHSSDYQNPSHTYDTSGVFDVKLVITDMNNVKDSLMQAVIVKEKPLADFSAAAVCQGAAAEIINTTNNKGLSVTSWFWDFGDGQTSIAEKPAAHGYLGAAEYIVVLKALTDNGCLDTIARKIIVGAYPVAAVTANAPLTFCKGDNVTLSVPYNDDYTYSWKPEGANISVSDSSRFVADYSGSFVAEVINRNGNCKTTSSPVSIVALPAPAAPSITYSGNLTFCQGDSIILSVANTTGYSYQWKLNGGAVGTNSNQYIAKSSGKYTLVVSNSNGCSVSSPDTVDVTVNPLPVVSDINLVGVEKFCRGGKATLSVPANSAYAYSWKRGTSDLQLTTNSIDATESGEYSVEVSQAGCKITTVPLKIEVVDKPARPDINPGTYKKDDCLGEDPPVLSVDNVVTGYSYQWYKNETPISSTTSIEVIESGNYYLEAVVDICPSERALAEIVFPAALPKPDLIAKGPTVWILSTSSKADKYKWFYNGTHIPTADNKSAYIAGQNMGTYRVAISDDGKCFSFSDKKTIPDIVGIEDPDPFKDVRIYPNPTTGMFTIEMNNNVFGELVIDIITQNGSKILNIKFEKTTEHFQTQIDLSGQGKGMYLINLSLDEFRAVRKVVVE